MFKKIFADGKIIWKLPKSKYLLKNFSCLVGFFNPFFPPTKTIFQKLKIPKQCKTTKPVQNVDNFLLPGITTTVSARLLLHLHPLSCPAVNKCPHPCSPCLPSSFSPGSLLWLSLVNSEQQEAFLG